MIPRDREAQASVAGQGKDILDRPLAKAAFAHDQRAVVVLQSAGNDFGCRCRASINQNDNRCAIGHITGHRPFCPPMVDVIFVAATLGYNLTLCQKGIGHGHCLIQDTAGVRPQIDNIAQRIAAKRFLDTRNRRDDVSAGLFGKTGNRNDANAVFHFPAHRLQVDDGACES